MKINRVMAFAMPLGVALLNTMAVATLTSPSLAEGGQTPPITIEMSLASTTAMQGEPLVLHYKITNPASQSVALQMGQQRESWLTVSLKDAAGQAAPSHKDIPLPFLGGVSLVEPGLSSGNSLQGSLEVGYWATPSHPGKYTLIVQTQLPYRFDGQPEMASDSQGGNSVLAQQFSLGLVITPAGHGHLRMTAETLRSRFAMGQDSDQKTDIASLFAIPEQDALPIWEEAANDLSLNILTRSEIARQLFHVHSINAFNTLATMARNPAEHDSIRESASLYMGAMYRNGDATLKSYIQTWYAAQGLKAPDIPIIRID